ncbi:MAG: bifunctional glutamate N-acetyltransferase/amino-acid acetyltransferase ArgJ [Endomicrobiia bacterium]
MNNIPKGFIFTGKNRLALFYSAVSCRTTGLFTKNLVKAAPVLVSQRKLSKFSSKIRAIIANSGCANACTGKKGILDAEKMCNVSAKYLNLKPEHVLVASTGVIGEFLPMKKIIKGIKNLTYSLTNSPIDAVKAIMTTDTYPKFCSRKFYIDKKEVRIWACIKGSGMIHPELATLLCFIFTDINISKRLQNIALKDAVDRTLNCLSVDGDTSTNDSVFLLSNGLAGNKIIISEKDRNFKKFYNVLNSVCEELAKKTVTDGEGATKFIKIKIFSAKDKNSARKIAECIATSPLVKTAIFGCDPNWGRIMAAIGRSGVKINPEKIDLFINGLCVVKNGTTTNLSTEKLKRSMRRKKIDIDIFLNSGSVWLEYYTCDLSYDYVKINASYRT